MDTAFIVPILALITLFSVIVFAIWSQRVTERAKQDPQHPKSALAADGPDRR